MELAELSAMLKHFYVEARNVEGKPYSRKQLVLVLTDFCPVPLKESHFP